MQQILFSSRFAVGSYEPLALHRQSPQALPGRAGSLSSSTGAAAHPLDSPETTFLCGLDYRIFQGRGNLVLTFR